MAASLTLKWGNVKGWDGFEEGTPAREALDKWADSGQGISATQRQTPEQRELICGIIDAVDGEIWNDWDGKVMSKDEAKSYVRNYGNCRLPLEPLAQIRTYHSGCDPQGRVEMLEKVLAELASHFEEAINYIDDPSKPENEFTGPTLIVLAGRNRLKAARAALEYRPAQMKGRE